MYIATKSTNRLYLPPPACVQGGAGGAEGCLHSFPVTHYRSLAPPNPSLSLSLSLSLS